MKIKIVYLWIAVMSLLLSGCYDTAFYSEPAPTTQYINLTLPEGIGSNISAGVLYSNGSMITSIEKPDGDLIGTPFDRDLDGNGYDITNIANLFINDDTNTNQTYGFTINGLDADDYYLSFKSSDININRSGHESDTFGYFNKSSSTNGGLQFVGFAESTSNNLFRCTGYGGTADTTKTQSSNALSEIAVTELQAGSLKNITQDGNVFAVRVYRSNQWQAQYILDEDGDSLQQGYIGLMERTAPGAGQANEARIYALQGGDGLTDLAAVYQDGTVDVFSQETTPLNAPIFRYPSGTDIDFKMIKPHAGIIQFVAVFPDNTQFIIREFQYYNVDKINANFGAIDEVPADWNDIKVNTDNGSK